MDTQLSNLKNSLCTKTDEMEALFPRFTWSYNYRNIPRVRGSRIVWAVLYTMTLEKSCSGWDVELSTSDYSVSVEAPSWEEAQQQITRLWNEFLNSF